MAKLGWGTPTLVSLSLGVIIEIPGNIAIVGVLKIALPAEEIGADRPAGQLRRARSSSTAAASTSSRRSSTRASSSSPSRARWRVLAAFGDDANFVLSVGGFHPSFDPPPLPVPGPASGSPSTSSTTRCRSCASRATSRSPPTPRSSARAWTCASASRTAASRGHWPSTRCSSSRRSTSSSRSRRRSR